MRSIRYQLRDDDLLFRRGIMFQRQVAVPYGRMQLVDITRGPVARALGLADLKFVTAAAATAVTIPGLPDGGGRPPARRARRARRDPPGGLVSAPARPAPVTNLADGEWHRLHPATPLLRGGLVFIAVLGFVIANLRERAIDLFLVIFAARRRAIRRS